MGTGALGAKSLTAQQKNVEHFSPSIETLDPGKAQEMGDVSNAGLLW